MKIVKYFLWTLWRIWFYILMGVPIIILSPILIITISSEKTYPQFFVLARLWAKIILFGMGLPYKIERDEEMQKGKSYMLVANHTSMTDIMLMLALIKNPFVFVGKKELVKIPLFGFFYKRTCILVDRNSSKSKNEVFKRAQSRLNKGLSICIFPEGISHSTGRLVPLRTGAARMALSAERGGTRVNLVPVGLNFERKTTFRSRVTVIYGQPFTGEDLADATVHPDGVRELTDRMAARMRRRCSRRFACYRIPALAANPQGSPSRLIFNCNRSHSGNTIRR